jgi:predicted nucleic acid-binding protein
VIIVDTNVASELMKPDPEPRVRDWVRSRRVDELYTTTITVAEILYGIQRLPTGRRRDLLGAIAEELFATFHDQVLGFDATAARQYAAIVARRERLGHPIDGFDAQIASICRAHGAALATRHTKDFRDAGLDLVDPWRAT